MSNLLHHQLALKMISGIGPTRAKRLVSYCGGVEAVFKASKKSISLIPGIGEYAVRQLDRDAALRAAEKEMKHIEAQGLKVLFFLDPAYPERLKHCDDGPVLLYTKGEMALNARKTVAIVGTRNATDAGKKNVDRLVNALVLHQALIVSGLAYGIDIQAHRAAMENGLQTVGVLGNSLDRIYPDAHRGSADKMQEFGGLISEFESGTKPDRENFPQRNRIVAGMVDAVIVVETAVKGGSMITANLAMGYNREVFAFPGRLSDAYSVGCNYLIKTNKAALIESADDLCYLMGWTADDHNGKEGSGTQQIRLFDGLSEQEQTLVGLIRNRGKVSLDNLSLDSGLTVSLCSTLLLEMEFKGAVKSLPGKVYTLA